MSLQANHNSNRTFRWSSWNVSLTNMWRWNLNSACRQLAFQFILAKGPLVNCSCYVWVKRKLGSPFLSYNPLRFSVSNVRRRISSGRLILDDLIEVVPPWRWKAVVAGIAKSLTSLRGELNPQPRNTIYCSKMGKVEEGVLFQAQMPFGADLLQTNQCCLWYLNKQDCLICFSG